MTTLDHSMLLLLEHGFEVYLPTEEQQIKLWPQSDLGDMEDSFPFSAEEWLKVPKARLVADRESKGGLVSVSSRPKHASAAPMTASMTSGIIARLGSGTRDCQVQDSPSKCKRRTRARPYVEAVVAPLVLYVIDPFDLESYIGVGGGWGGFVSGCFDRATMRVVAFVWAPCT